MTKPVRLQLSRKKGFNLQALSIATNGMPAVNVTRQGAQRGKWGNPCRIGMYRDYTAADAVRDYRRWLNREDGVQSFANVFGPPPTCEEIDKGLRGKNLACWCKPGEPCHADVLLEIANR